MNISLCFSDFPSPGHAFRIYCFLACGYLADDGSFTRNIKHAKVFAPDDFNAALDYAHDQILHFLLNDFNSRGALGLFCPNKDAHALSGANIDAKVFIHLSSIHSSVRL